MQRALAQLDWGSQIAIVAEAGSELASLQKAGDWCKVRIGATIGWIQASNITLTAPHMRRFVVWHNESPPQVFDAKYHPKGVKHKTYTKQVVSLWCFCSVGFICYLYLIGVFIVLLAVFGPKKLGISLHGNLDKYVSAAICGVLPPIPMGIG